MEHDELNPPAPAAGWYPVEGSGPTQAFRWWDGAAWTGQSGAMPRDRRGVQAAWLAAGALAGGLTALYLTFHLGGGSEATPFVAVFSAIVLVAGFIRGMSGVSAGRRGAFPTPTSQAVVTSVGSMGLVTVLIVLTFLVAFADYRA